VKVTGRILSKTQDGIPRKITLFIWDSLWINFRAAKVRKQQTKNEKAWIIIATALFPCGGSHRETTSMQMCLPSRVAIVAPINPVHKTRLLTRASPQAIPVEKRFRSII
jgi:hypothetical protein